MYSNWNERCRKKSKGTVEVFRSRSAYIKPGDCVGFCRRLVVLTGVERALPL